MEIQYRKGNHGNTDMLSRTDCETCIQYQMIHKYPNLWNLETKIMTIMLANEGTALQQESHEIDKN